MKTVWLIFKKDLRYFGPLLLAWLVLLTLDTTTKAAGCPNLGFLGGILLTMAHWLVFIVLVVSLIQEDRLVGDKEFWITRPVSPIALVSAKVISLAVWLILPSTVAHVLALRWLGATPHLLLVAGLGVALWTTTLALWAAMLAAVTTTVAQWTIAAISSLFATIAIVQSGPLLQQIGRTIRVDWPTAPIIGCVLALALLLYQAVGRRRNRTIALWLIGSVVLGHVDEVWLFRNSPESPAAEYYTPAPQLKIRLTAPLDDHSISTGWVMVPLEIGNYTENRHFSVERVESRLTTNSGVKKWDSMKAMKVEGVSTPFSWEYPGQGSPESNLTEPEAYRAVGWNDRDFSPVAAALWGRKGIPLLPEDSGKLESKLFLREYSVNLTAELPLREGAGIRVSGAYLRITKIDPSVGFVVTLEHHSLQAQMPFRVFLLNRSQHALIAGFEISSSTTSTASPFPTIRTYSERIRFGSQDYPESESVALTADWLSGASLAIVSLTPGDRVEKTLAIDPFTIPPPRAK